MALSVRASSPTYLCKLISADEYYVSNSGVEDESEKTTSV